MQEGLGDEHVPDVTLLTQRTWTYYAALVVIVMPVQAIPVLSWLVIIFDIWRNGPSLFRWSVLSLERAGVLWALLEALFSLHHSFLVDKLARRPARIDQAEISHLRSLFYRVLRVGLDDKPRSGVPPIYCNGDAELNFEDIPTLAFDDPRAVDFRNSLRTWFSRSSWSSISRAHLLSWLSWGMFNSSLEFITEEQRAFVDEALVMTERRAGARLPDITHDTVLNGSAGGGPKTLRLSLDPISVSSRPLAAYVLINIAAVTCGSWFEWKYGAQYKTMGGTKYLIRTPKGPHSGPPIIFLHGLGIGLAQYTLFIGALLSSSALSHRTIVVPLQPHVSQQIFHPRHLKPPKPKHIVRDLKAIIEGASHHENKAVVVSHSNGTVLHAWLLKAHPELIGASCFVDPVTFCLWEGDVCYNFVYDPPTTGIKLLTRYYVGSELGTAYYIQRNFDWSANTLFFEEIPNALDPKKTLFVLAGNDSILNSERVRRYLKWHGVTADNLLYVNGAAHGEALIPGSPVKKDIIRWIESAG